jgi:hypothetical protein
LLVMARLGMRSWFEHVASRSNVADGGTRNSTEVADALDVVLQPKALPPWPSDTLSAPAAVWLKWLFP